MKGKVMEELAKKDEVNKSIGKEKSMVFLNLKKHSEYNMVELLKKTPSRISLLLLILRSKSHWKALQKVLNEAYVPHEIASYFIKHLVEKI